MPARRGLPAEPARRGWCPSLARPMPTGDGLLARVHPPLGRLTAEQIWAVAEGARRCGNAHIDVTARANLQIRGVRAETLDGLVRDLERVGLGDARADGGPQRLTLTSPLAGLGARGACVLALAAGIETAGRTIAGLPAKTLVAVAGPGVPGEDADVVLHPLPGAFRMILADGPGIALPPDPGEAAAAVARVLAAFAAGGRRRVRDLDASERTRCVTAATAGGAIRPGFADPEATRTETGQATGAEGLAAPPAGLALHHDRWVLSVEAPFGRCTADALEDLAQVAAGLPDRDAWVSPARGFVLGLPDAAVGGLALRRLAAAGLITRSDDPRRAVAACPGAPACNAATTPVPEDARRLADAFAGFAARGLRAHVSGCAKGCAHPRPADLTLVGEAGRYRWLVAAAPGEAGAGPLLPFGSVLERIRRAEPAAGPPDAAIGTAQREPTPRTLR